MNATCTLPKPTAVTPAGRRGTVTLRDRRRYRCAELVVAGGYVDAVARRVHRDLSGERYYPARRRTWSWSEVAEIAWGAP